MNVQSLIVEVTRKCNIQCQHCLRGDAMNLNMKKEHIDSLLNQIDSIGSVVFTGGEPTLNIPIMEYFLEVCKNKGVDVQSFYIATNGKNISEKFVMFCLKMYSYCDEKDQCRIDVSNDIFHRDECDYDLSLLEGLKFFGKKFEKDNFNYNNWSSLKSEGRMENNRYKNTPIVIDESRITSEEIENEIDVYLNCKGEIINGCDWSYKNQSKHKLCDVDNFQQYYESVELVEMEVE